MDNWGGSLLQRVRNCVNVVDSGRDTAEKYIWLRTQKAALVFTQPSGNPMQKPICRNEDLQSSCLTFEKSGFLGPSENLKYWWSYVHQKGRTLHNGLIILTLLSWWPRQWVVTEPACHKCQTLWQFLPHKLTVPIVRAHPNSWHHHHPSRRQHLCRHKVGHC